MTDEELERLKEKFSEHKAYYSDEGDMTRLSWGLTGTRRSSIHYIFWRHQIFVTGDFGEYIYSLSEKADPYKIAESYDLYYWHSKCVASENGRIPRIWSATRAKQTLVDWKKQREKEYPEETVDISDALHHCISKEDWNYFLQGPGAYELFCENWPEYASIGRECPIHCEIQLEALKMAVEQMKAMA